MADPMKDAFCQSNNSFIRTEITGMSSYFFHQKLRVSGTYNACNHLEMNTSECFEAYGYYRGNRYCKDYLNDWRECTFNRMTGLRQAAMKAERLKQVISGERGFDRKSFYGRQVQADSYIGGPYQPQ